MESKTSLTKIVVKDFKVLNNIKVENDSKTGEKIIILNGERIKIQQDKKVLLTSPKKINSTVNTKIEENSKSVSSLPHYIIEEEKMSDLIMTTNLPSTSTNYTIYSEDEQKINYQSQSADVINNLMEFVLEESHNSNIMCTLINGNKLIQHPDNQEKQRKMFFDDLNKALKFDISGNLPIHTSVLANKKKLLKRNILIFKALGQNINIVNKQSYSPLHLAVLNGVNTEILDILITEGSDLNLKDSEGNTVFHLAIVNEQFLILEYLLSVACQMSFNLNVFNFEGYTPLILACLHKSYEAVALLLQYNIDPNTCDMKSGRTALFHAVESHNVPIVELLMKHNAKTNIRNFFGTSVRDAMFELDDIPINIKRTILGSCPTTELKRKQEHESDQEFDCEPKKKAKRKSKK